VVAAPVASLLDAQAMTACAPGRQFERVREGLGTIKGEEVTWVPSAESWMVFVLAASGNFEPGLLQMLQRHHPDAAIVGAVCTDAAVLGKNGTFEKVKDGFAFHAPWKCARSFLRKHGFGEFRARCAYPRGF